MLEKRDIMYYRRLAYTQIAIGAIVTALSIVTLVVYFLLISEYTRMGAEIHTFAPYWVGIPLLLQGRVTMAAARTGKRWPLGLWLPLFIIAMFAIAAYTVVMPCFRAYSLDGFQYECTSTASCTRALNTTMILSNVNYMFAILSLIPELLMFVLVCNDLCCASCRRAASVPQVIVTRGTQDLAGQCITIQEETVTYRTDHPGTSSAPTTAQLPQKQGDSAEQPLILC